MGIDLKTKTGKITLTAPVVTSGGSVDLSNYYTKEETYSKTEIDDMLANLDFSGGEVLPASEEGEF